MVEGRGAQQNGRFPCRHERGGLPSMGKKRKGRRGRGRLTSGTRVTAREKRLAGRCARAMKAERTGALAGLRGRACMKRAVEQWAARARQQAGTGEKEKRGGVGLGR